MYGSADPDPEKHNYRSGTMLTPKINKISQRRGKTETDSGAVSNYNPHLGHHGGVSFESTVIRKLRVDFR
jgi:hypothetical protein